ncbi:hypothetical protein [Variovorax sp. E3]|uniref:hypothetical protein n=1 Tax=Variovorax sp. E3 TaxID=1914993 RepID=UPI0018DEC484|nr:hypothetical protein [Variovorax sp. E3]
MGLLDQALEKYNLTDKINKQGVSDILEELKFYYEKEGREPEEQLTYIFEQALPDGDRDEYLSCARCDCLDGYIENVRARGNSPDLIKSIKEKGDFNEIAEDYDRYSKAIWDDDLYMVKKKSADIDFSGLQQTFVERAIRAYSHDFTEEERELFRFENRSKITATLASKSEVFYELCLPEIRQKIDFEKALPYAQTLALLEQTQPTYEPGTYFTDALDKVNELNAPKKKTLKI